MPLISLLIISDTLGLLNYFFYLWQADYSLFQLLILRGRPKTSVINCGTRLAVWHGQVQNYLVEELTSWGKEILVGGCLEGEGGSHYALA